MQGPTDISRPFFSYGIFRPGQIGFFQVRGFIKVAQPSRITGNLRLRDGLPIFDPHAQGNVSGMLLHFIDNVAAEKAYQRISRIEPDNHYRWGEIPCEETIANVLLGRSPQKGSVTCEGLEWNCWQDPLFNAALDVVEETMQSQHGFEWDLKPLFRLQMAYLLLWSAIERYVSLRYHLGTNVSEKVSYIATEPAFGAALKKYVSESRSVFRADQPKTKIMLDPNCPEKAKDYYYQIRSNITHRGKAATTDHDRLHQSLGELLLIFREVLNAARNDAAP